MPNSKPKVLFMAPYPYDKAPSQRFRFEQYLADLKQTIDWDFAPFLSLKTWNILYLEGHLFAKAFGILSGFWRRFLLLFSVFKYDFIFLHREASPVGPPVFEFILSKILRKKIIYDFDDAIWLANTSEQNKIAAFVKYHSKVASICRWAHKVTVGNSFLGNYAKQQNQQVVFLPTTIDLDYHKNQTTKKTNPIPVIGWTGTHSTVQYLKAVIPVLEKLASEISFEFILISNQDADFEIPNKRFIKWQKETEIEDLSKIDIGIMPLEDNDWSNGKCGFKAIQYMSIGLPSVVSPVGVNKDLIENGISGYLARTDDEWFVTLKSLCENPTLRNEIGEKGKETIVKKYSKQANLETYRSLFR